jgi:hypothetical protein
MVVFLTLLNCVATNNIAILEGERAVQSNKIDTGTPSYYRSLSISGYYSMATRKPKPFISKSKMSIKYLNDSTTQTVHTTRSKSTMYETPQSLGGELRYDITESFGIGTIFDYSFNSEQNDSLIYYEVHDNPGVSSFSFYLRVLKTDDLFIFGYRPEVGITSVKGDYIVFSDTSVYLSPTNYRDALEYGSFQETDLFFRQTMFLRLFPELPFSVFGGIQHSFIPAHMRYNEASVNSVTIDREHVFMAYPGVGINLAKSLHLDAFATFPLYHTRYENKSPISVGLKAQFRFF